MLTWCATLMANNARRAGLWMYQAACCLSIKLVFLSTSMRLATAKIEEKKAALSLDS
jgi:hypothetical protein